MLTTSNPTLSPSTFRDVDGSWTESMTIDGTVNKTLFLLALVTAAAAGVWYYVTGGTGALQADRVSLLMPLAMGGAIAGLVIGLIIAFSKKAILAPLYAIAEGVFIGALATILEQRAPGIALQAASLTVAVFFVMLGSYRFGFLKATPAFKRGVIAATMALAVFYLLRFALSMFGVDPFGSMVSGNSALSIGFSVLVVGLAAFNLILDFDQVERGARAGAPKAMEWYGAYALLVTLVWLYIEILRLLSKLNRR